MKLVAATAAAMAVAAQAQNEMVPMENDMMMEEPWYAFLYDYGLEVTEEKTTFNMKDPKISMEYMNDGSSMVFKSPWYKEKYTIKEKETAYEMDFKNEMPGLQVMNKMRMKQAVFNKNDKVADPNCTNSNPKKCLIKTPVGLQHKREFEGEHNNEMGHYKVWEYNNYVTDMEMKPIEVHFRQGYDFGHKATGEVALGMTMEGDMAEAMNNPWYTKGQTKMDAEMKYKKYTDPASLETMDHWDSTTWSFSHTTDDSEMGENVVAAEGSSNVASLTWEEEEKTAEMIVNYDSSCNMGWSDSGVNTQKWENTDSCMDHMQMAMEGRWEEFFMANYGDKPCTWSSTVEGTHTNQGEEMPYEMAIAIQFTAFNDHKVYYKNSMMEVTSWAPLVEISTEMNDAGEKMTTFNHMGEDMMTVNCDKLEAHHNEMSDKMARKIFEMYKYWEFEQAEWAKMDWTNEEHIADFVAATINWDYPMQKMADMEQTMVKEFQAMECSYPHWDYMSEEVGVTVHDALKEKMYAMKSEMIQKMQLMVDVDYMRLSHLSWYFYSVDGSMSAMDIHKQLWSMDYADAYDWVADMMESEMLKVYVSDVMFMQKYLGEELIKGFTPMSMEEEEALRERFNAALPDVATLRNYANMIRNFEPVEMSWVDVDMAANDMCNAHFEMFLAGHKEWADLHISYVTEHREMTQEWVGKYNQWINTPRNEVEAMFDEFESKFNDMKNSAIYECEYMYWGSPMKVMFAGLTEECQSLMLEKYPEIMQWEADMMMEME